MKGALLAMILLSACGDNSGRPGPDATPAMFDGSNSTEVPRIEPATCKFKPNPNLDATCGNLIVYENRTTKARTIKLHFIQYKKTAGATSTNATIYLDGGPGGDGSGIVSAVNYFGPQFLQGLQIDGDFLTISQRGTAQSEPFLDCKQADCDDFAAVAELPMYNTANNADDIDELRSALGYAKLNLYGISYGSRLGLEVIRRHGDNLRSAVIEGLVPAQVNWPGSIASSFYSSLTALNAACAAAGSCGTTYGNLADKLIASVDSLNANPVPIQFTQGSFDLDGDTWASLLFQMLYSKSTFPYLPLMISDLAARRTDRVTPILQALFGGGGGGDEGGFSSGLYYGVVCNEIFNPGDPTAFDTINAAVPATIRNIFQPQWLGMIDQCAQYPKTDPSLQTQLKAPVTSAVRTFVSSGRQDPITPPAFGVIAASGLSNSFHVIHENSGHGATLQSTCGQQNLFKFLATPEATIDTSCAATIPGNYMVQSFAPTKPPYAAMRVEMGLAPIPPFLKRKLVAR